MDTATARKIFANDRYAALSGVHIVEAGLGYCTTSLKIEKKHLNAANVVQGGAIFTLADLAFAVASNSHGQLALAINVNISYLSAVSAGTLHVMGLSLDNTVEMIYLFEPLGGKVAALVLILGIAGAGLSTVFPIILIAPWLICDYTGKERNIQSPLFRWLGLAGILFSFGFLVMKEKPPGLMVFSQAFQACILPAIAIPVYFLLSNDQLMKGNMMKKSFRIGLIAVIIFSLITTYFAIIDLF